MARRLDRRTADQHAAFALELVARTDCLHGHGHLTKRASPGGDAGGRDAGVCRVLHGDRAGPRNADLAAVGRAGDPARAGAVEDR